MRFLLRLGLLAIACAAGCGGGTQAIVFDESAPLLVELRGDRILFNHHVRFEHDSAVIQPESYELLDRVAQIVVDHPQIHRVQVQGHSSTDGDEAHNQELSAARAEAVATYLREHGVTPNAEVTSQGYGETYPLCQEETEACHAQNRRVEFFVDNH